MSSATSYVDILADGDTTHQRIDGFGVNINSKYWDASDPAFIRAMDLLIHDLGCTLYRIDIWGKSNWVDPESEKDASVLTNENYARIYQGEVFQKGWAMMRYLNEKGIEPYLTASGDVPDWMLGDDGKTLVQYEQFSDMLASMVNWAKRKENLRFSLFGPLNETDIGSPEGPTILAQEFAKVVEVLDRNLAERGLDDVRYVVPEVARLSSDYIRELVAGEQLRDHIGAFALHGYSDYPTESYADVVALVANSPYAGTSVWLGEYGDLDQTGEKEWYVAWVSTSRVLNALEAGLNGAIVWDAYDNYHDHDGRWTIYGLIRVGQAVYTPKKRYYAAKQIYRFVRPGFDRISVSRRARRQHHPGPSGSDAVRIQGFADPERTHITLVGMNTSSTDIFMKVTVTGFPESVTSGKVSYYRTTESENCVRVGEVNVRDSNSAHGGIDVCIPGHSIFTLTNVE